MSMLGVGVFIGLKMSSFDMIKSLCEGLDIPTPVLLNKHLLDFNKFSMTLFKQTDFIEKVNFDKFIVEYLPEE